MSSQTLMEGELYQHCGKRSFDLFLTVPALICLSPLYGILALLIRWRMGSPMLFRQMRPGLQGDLLR
jgi:lipopolysaccharide/colanic/teichoic acid biosynthesis glycosyltransferase